MDLPLRRVQQTTGSQTTNYLWDEVSPYGDVVLETDGSRGTLASYLLGGTELLSQTRGGVTSYYLHDGQGSVRALTDSARTVTDTYAYTAFGETFSQTGTTINPYLYTGQQFDPLTGLYSLRARYYDPENGRFLTRDTIGIGIDNPSNYNFYSYTTNNSVNNYDPLGHQTFEEYGLFQEKNAEEIGEIHQLGRMTKATYDVVALVMRAKYYIAVLSNVAYQSASRLTAGVSLIQNLENGSVRFVFTLMRITLAWLIML